MHSTWLASHIFSWLEWLSNLISSSINFNKKKHKLHLVSRSLRSHVHFDFAEIIAVLNTFVAFATSPTYPLYLLEQSRDRVECSRKISFTKWKKKVSTFPWRFLVFVECLTWLSATDASSKIVKIFLFLNSLFCLDDAMSLILPFLLLWSDLKILRERSCTRTSFNVVTVFSEFSSLISILPLFGFKWIRWERNSLPLHSCPPRIHSMLTSTHHQLVVWLF